MQHVVLGMTKLYSRWQAYSTMSDSFLHCSPPNNKIHLWTRVKMGSQVEMAYGSWSKNVYRKVDVRFPDDVGRNQVQIR